MTLTQKNTRVILNQNSKSLTCHLQMADMSTQDRRRILSRYEATSLFFTYRKKIADQFLQNIKIISLEMRPASWKSFISFPGNLDQQTNTATRGHGDAIELLLQQQQSSNNNQPRSV